MTGFEPLAAPALTAAATGLTKIAINVLSETGGRWLGRMQSGIDERTRTLITTALGKYVANYQERHCKLRVLGMRRPVDLEDVYTSVRLLDSQAIQKLESIEALEKAYREQGERRFSGNRMDGAKPGVVLAQAEQYLMVLGSPGAGKSTFLRKIGLETMKGNNGQLKHHCIPVFLELKRLTAPSIDLKQRIADELETCNFPRAKDFAERALKQGKLLILLDGLDEVPSDNQLNAIQAIQDFVDQYRENRFIASCRTAAYRTRFRQFTDVAMADFDDSQIEQYITNWFSSPDDWDAKKAETCWKILQQPENKAAKELAQTPLLLTFLCLVYSRSQRFPAIRAQLYSKALRILLEEWAADKGIMQGDIYEGLSTELEEVLLAEIACINFVNDQLFFTRRELVAAIKTFLANTLDAPPHLDGEAVLNAIAIQQGIFIERAEDAYSFSHLTLQEYLTAQYIVDHQRWHQLVTDHLFDQRWREVFLLVPGLMRGGANEFLQNIETTAADQINTPKLWGLLQWADDVTRGSSRSNNPSAKRLVAIYCALALAFALTRDLDLNRALDFDRVFDRVLNFARILDRDLTRTCDLDLAHRCARDLARDLDLARACALARAYGKLAIFSGIDFSQLVSQLIDFKSQIPENNDSIKTYPNFVDSIQQCWCDTLRLNSGLLTLSIDESKALNNYFYANELMIKCKESAVRVSPQVWAEIEEQMITIRNL
ncbi:MAG: NACHT domain-containing protein [Cyanothece sp. SIO2G6]|nr:NACHT domain-containing protein [Cyanothece sp. SIO2G6]